MFSFVFSRRYFAQFLAEFLNNQSGVRAVKALFLWGKFLYVLPIFI